VVALDEAANTGRSAALRVLDGDRPTGLTVVVTGRRSQWASRSMFERLGLSMTGFDVVTVKMGYLEPVQYEAAAGWLLALTPGGVGQDRVRVGRRRRRAGCARAPARRASRTCGGWGTAASAVA